LAVSHVNASPWVDLKGCPSWARRGHPRMLFLAILH
jgi:hypothetical protein